MHLYIFVHHNTNVVVVIVVVVVDVVAVVVDPSGNRQSNLPKGWIAVLLGIVVVGFVSKNQ